MDYFVVYVPYIKSKAGAGEMDKSVWQERRRTGI